MKDKIFYSITFLILFLSFTFNIFHIAHPDYSRFDRGDEGYVMGRIIASEVEGLFSYGGLPCNYVYYRYLPDENGNPVTTEVWEAAGGKQENLRRLPNEMVQGQMYDDYINNRKVIDGYADVYMTQPSMMGNIYSIINIILPISNQYKLYLFRLINLFLTTLAFIFIIGWIKRNFGYKVGIIVFVLLLLSPWLMRFTHNLWWALWSFYIPFITMLLVLEKKEKHPASISDNKVFLYLGIAMFVKFLFTGAEFISTTAIMAVCPVIYYSIKTQLKLKDGILFFIKSSFSVILGAIAGFLFLFTQIKLYKGTWQAGLDHLIFSFTKRSAANLDISTWEVLKTYLTDQSVFSWHFFPYITFGFGIFILIAITFSIIVAYNDKKKESKLTTLHAALIITAAISVLAPLSWIIIFVQHAHTHPAFDYITWYMPFCIYAFIIMAIPFTWIKRKNTKQS